MSSLTELPNRYNELTPETQVLIDKLVNAAASAAPGTGQRTAIRLRLIRAIITVRDITAGRAR